MAQLGQGWVVAAVVGPAGDEKRAPSSLPVLEPVAGVTGAGLEREGPLASGARNWPIGAPQVSQ
jgi:hypothetical protein